MMEKPLLILDFPSRQEKAPTHFGDRIFNPLVRDAFLQPPLKEEFLPSHLRDLLLKSHVKEELWESQWAEDSRPPHFDDGSRQSHLNEALRLSQTKEELRESQWGAALGQSQIEEELRQSQSRDELRQSQIEEEVWQSQSSEELRQLQMEQELQESQLREELRQSKLREEFRQSQLREELRQSQLREELRQSQLREELRQSQLREELRQSQLREEHRQSQLREELRQSQLDEEARLSQVTDEFRQPQSRAERAAGTEEAAETPIIIDLDTYEDANEPSETSMALVAVPGSPQGDSNSSTELAIVRTDDTESSGVVSSQSDGQMTSPSGGVWDGPPRWASSTVGILTVQCARCLKWRVVPSRETYEAIREHIVETPWVCENALPWRPDSHCELPSDLNQDSQMVWAIDKPNLPSSPPGWQRKVVVRRDCSTRFADVYYTSPDGKTLRSMVEVSRYLEENPGSVPEGTKIGQFSYTSPRPLPGIWTARKRNRMPSVVSFSTSQGEGKKARAPQPLAKQLAQKLLQGTIPPSLPVAPACPVPSAPSSQTPAGTSAPGPHTPQLVTQAVNIAPAPNFTNAPSVTSFPELPPVRYPFSPSFVSSPSPTPHQVPVFSPGGPVATLNAERLDSSPTMAASRSKKQQQKSRLGGIPSMSQNMSLHGVLPLRDTSGA